METCSQNHLLVRHWHWHEKKGLKTALATSSMAFRGEKLLDHFELQNAFDFKTFGDDVPAHKPDPAPLFADIEKKQHEPLNQL